MKLIVSTLFAGGLALASAATPSAAAVAPVDQSFSFEGICLDCQTTRVGMATLVLANYVPGSAITDDNFVSFSYTGDISYAVNSEFSVSGSINSTPGFYDFHLMAPVGEFTTIFFDSSTSSSWNTGFNNLSFDMGVGGTWNGAVNAVPEPSTWAMMLLGLGGIGGFIYLRSKPSSASMNYRLLSPRV